MKRRTFLARSIASGFATCIVPFRMKLHSGYPVEMITDGPLQHWFGYYDKWQVDATGRYALGNAVPLIFRSPMPSDSLDIGLIDLKKGNQWKSIGKTTAWGWQQGCMLQWVPGGNGDVIWNDRSENGFVSHIYNIYTGKTRTLPRPVYTLSPDGSYGLSVNFGRLQDMRPGYGYALEERTTDMERAPEDDGIFKVDLETGRSELLISLARLASLPREQGSVAGNFHWCNHLLIAPSGDRFIFLNRSRPYRVSEEMKKEKDWVNKYVSRKHITRAITANTDGSDLYVLNDSGYFSHFIWKDDRTITAWAWPEGGDKEDPHYEAFYHFYDHTKKYDRIDPEKMPLNGHNTYVPETNNEWILNDTYPQGEERTQELYLYHLPTRRKVVLGEFYMPPEFYSEWRCDLHPRCDQQGNHVFFDSTHTDGRRQMYKIDIRDIVKS